MNNCERVMDIKHRNIFIILRLEFQNTEFSLNGAIHSFWRSKWKQMNSVVLIPRIFVIKLPIIVSVNVFKILWTTGKNRKDRRGCSRIKTIDITSKHHMYLRKLFRENCLRGRKKEASQFFFLSVANKGLGECLQIIFFASCCAY